MENDEQELVASVLGSMPPPEVRGDFIARVNARIDGAQGWLGLADFRTWTLRLVPAAVALAVVAIFWQARGPAASRGVTASTAVAAATFSPSSSADWQQDVSGDALLDAALMPAGGSRVR